MQTNSSYETAYKELEQALNDWGRRYELTTAFGDLLAMLVCECTPHWINSETERPIGQYIDRYLEVVKRYDPDHVRRYYPKVCETLFAAYDQSVTATGDWCDPLGDYFQAIASRRDQAWKGQFFTPPSVCDLMAALTADTEHAVDMKILDPTCGSGRCLIAYDRSGEPKPNTFYVGVDVDVRCVRIAALNFFFHGIRGVVICGNSLSMEMRFGYRIWHPETGMGIGHLSQEQCLSYLVIPTQEPPTAETPTGKPIEGTGGQLLLFE